MKKPLIMFCGLSGSGKSYNAQYLKKQLEGYIYLNPELVRRALRIKTYSRKDTPKVLAKMVDTIARETTKGHGVVVDANLKTNDTRQVFYDAAGKNGVVLVEVVASDKDARARMLRREQAEGVANHPQDPRVRARQKILWQDVALDFKLPENARVAWIRYDSSRGKANIRRGSNPFAKKIMALLEKKEV